MNKPQQKHAPELTVRGMILGAAITVVFMAANVYLGLKTGMTFSSSIPAAVISMSVLRVLGSSGILENNIVQTQASAAGTLCNVILVLPGLILIGYWQHFPLWQTLAVCLLGGLLGVAYSVPLRRVMVVKSDLPFPEGVAAAEVLKAGHKGDAGGGDGGESGLRELGISAGVAALLNLITTGFRLLPEKLAGSAVFGPAVFTIGGSLSLALIGVGYLVRIGACLALCLGLFIAWGIAVPLLMTLHPSPSGATAAAAEDVWSGKVRLIGAGIIATGGLWTVVTLVRPMIESIRSALQADGGITHRQDRDIPMTWVGAGIAALCLFTAGLFAWFADGADFGVLARPCHYASDRGSRAADGYGLRLYGCTARLVVQSGLGHRDTEHDPCGGRFCLRFSPRFHGQPWPLYRRVDTVHDLNHRHNGLHRER